MESAVLQVVVDIILQLLPFALNASKDSNIIHRLTLAILINAPLFLRIIDPYVPLAYLDMFLRMDFVLLPIAPTWIGKIKYVPFVIKAMKSSKE